MGISRIIDPATGAVLDPRTDPDAYSLDVIRRSDVWTPQAVRAEYSRLRKIANQRLKRIGSDPVGRRSATYRYNIGAYKPVAELTPGELKTGLAQVARMIAAETGTLRGIKRQISKAVETLQLHGHTYVNISNFQDFGEFMREWRDSSFRSRGSEWAADTFDAVVKNGTPPAVVAEKFAEWRTEREESAELAAKQKRSRRGIEVSSEQLTENFKDFISKS